MSYRFLITCPKGLEELLSQEVEQFGFNAKLKLGAVIAEIEEGDFYQIYRFCLYSRLANRVIWLLSEFQCVDKESLFRQVYNTPWMQHFDADKTIAVNFRGSNRFINNSHYGAMLVKDAVVDHFVERADQRPNVDTKNPDVSIYMALGKRTSSLGIDISGGSLHKRGYRLQSAKAPLKENLAAALVQRARQFAPEGNLVDPFCGSATLLIEGVLADLNIASQCERERFGFEALKKFNAEYFTSLKEEALTHKAQAIADAKQALQDSGQSALAFGFDVDGSVFNAANANIKRAGLEGLIQLEQRAIKDFKRPDVDTALLLMNPPYGERLADREQLLGLYATIGDKLKQQCQGDKAAILSSDTFLLKSIGLQKTKRYKFSNGKLETEWLLFNLYKKDPQHQAEKASKTSETGNESLWQSQGQNAKSAHEGTDNLTNATPKTANNSFDEKEMQLIEMVANRLRKNIKKFSKWAKRNSIQAYRLYDADMPEYAFAVDSYDGQLHVTEYAAPKSVDEFAAYKRKRQFLKALEQVFDISVEQMHLKERKQQKGKQQYEKINESGNRFVVSEGDAVFEVNLKDYLDTGLFLDHRPIRLKLAAMAKNKRVLNLFCYTASASVHAALGGALSTDSVDMSQTYIQWAERNFKLNKLDLSKHRLHRDNVLEWVENNRLSYDLIFCDPPSFSNSKRMENTWDVQRDHQALVETLMGQLEPDGVLVFSNNLRKFKLAPALQDAFAVEDYSAQSIDEDFKRNPNIHKCWLIRHKS